MLAVANSSIIFKTYVTWKTFISLIKFISIPFHYLQHPSVSKRSGSALSSSLIMLNGSFWCDSAVRLSHGSPCRRCCTQNQTAGWRLGDVVSVSVVFSCPPAGFSPLLTQFSAVWVHVCQLHVPFADILELQHWPTCWVVSRGQFTIQKILVGMRPSSMRRTCPSRCRRRSQSIRDVHAEGTWRCRQHFGCLWPCPAR